MIGALALVNECEIERRQRLIIDADVKIMVLQCRVDVAAGILPIVAAEGEDLWGERERAERRPTIRLVAGHRVDVVPILGREIFDAGAYPLAGVRGERVEAGRRVRSRRARQVRRALGELAGIAADSKR